MATSRTPRRPTRLIAVAAACAATITLVPTSGYAEPVEPATAADAQTQVVELNHRLEVVTEDYNEARIILAAKQAEVAAVEEQLVEVRAELADLDDQVRVVAANAYKGDQLGSFTALMSSGSPQELLDRLNTLDAISAHSNGVLTELTDAEQRAADLTTQAEDALAEAERTAADVDAKKAFIEGELPRLEALLAALTEAERQAAFAAHLAAEEAAADEVVADEVAADTSDAGPPPGSDAAAPSTRSAPSTPGSPIAAPTQAAQIAVDTAYAQLGKPYQWGGAGPNSFDCSGLTMYSYAAAGISLPHSSRMQATMGVEVPRDQMAPGDLVAFGNPVYHIAIYIGDGNMITAPQTGDVVKIQSISVMSLSAVRRVATG